MPFIFDDNSATVSQPPVVPPKNFGSTAGEPRAFQTPSTPSFKFDDATNSPPQATTADTPLQSPPAGQGSFVFDDNKGVPPSADDLAGLMKQGYKPTNSPPQATTADTLLQSPPAGQGSFVLNDNKGVPPSADDLDGLMKQGYKPTDSDLRTIYAHQNDHPISTIASNIGAGAMGIVKPFLQAPGEIAADGSPSRILASLAEGPVNAAAGTVGFAAKPILSAINAIRSNPANAIKNAISFLIPGAGPLAPDLSTPESREADYERWRLNYLSTHDVGMTPLPTSTMESWQQYNDPDAELPPKAIIQPLPATSAAIGTLASLPMFEGASEASGLSNLITTPSLDVSGKVLGGLGKGLSAAGKVAKTVGGLPSAATEGLIEKVLGETLADKLGNAVDVGELPIAGAAALLGHPAVAGVLGGAKALETAGSVLGAAGEYATRLAEADPTSPFGRLFSVAKDATAPEWMRALSNSWLAKVPAAVADAAMTGGKSAVAGGIFGAGLSALSGDDPETIGQNIGAGAALGVATSAVAAPALRKARILLANIGAVGDLFQAHVADGIQPDALKGVSNDAMTWAAVAQQIFSNGTKIRFAPEGADSPLPQSAYGQAGQYVPETRTAWINLSSGRDPAETVLHEIIHPIFDNVVANTPEIKQTIADALSNAGKTPLQAKIQYVMGELRGQLKGQAPDAQKELISNQIQARDAASQQATGDPDHWIYSELLAESAVQALYGQHPVLDVTNPGLMPTLKEIALPPIKDFLTRLGVQFKEAPAREGRPATIFPGFENVIDSPPLRKTVYSLIRAQKDFMPGLSKTEPQGVPISKDMWGNHPGATLNPQANGTQANDFVVKLPDGRVIPRTPPQINRLLKSRRDEINQLYPSDAAPVAPTDTTPEIKPRVTPSGLVERSGTTLGPDFDSLTTVGQKTKTMGHAIEQAIANGEGMSGWLQQIGKGADWKSSVQRNTGAVEAQYKDFIPYAFKVDKQGNLLVQNYSLTAFQRKAAQWAQRHGPISLDLWGGNVGHFTQDVALYLKNHAENLPGEANNLGVEKKNVINGFLIGGNRTFGEKNPLRSSLKGEDRQGIVRSYRLDRLETLEPLQTDLKQPQYNKQVQNFSPDLADEQLKRIGDMSGSEFVDFLKTTPSKALTNEAWRLGQSVTSPEEASKLLAHQQEEAQKFQVAKGKKDFSEMSNAAMKGQFFREAYEAATGTGSAGEALSKNPDYKPPAPLSPELHAQDLLDPKTGTYSPPTLSPGYADDFSKSNNAIEAEDQGRFPASEIARQLKVPVKFIKENAPSTGEWHHTSKFYNSTAYYDLQQVKDWLNGEGDYKVEGQEPTGNDKLAEFKMQQSSTAKNPDLTMPGASLKYLEWSGTRNHPHATEVTEDNVTIRKKPTGVMVEIQRPDGSTFKKSLKTRGFEIKHPETGQYGPADSRFKQFSKPESNAENPDYKPPAPLSPELHAQDLLNPKTGTYSPPTDPDKEHIVSAAIQTRTGKVYRGLIHPLIMEDMIDKGVDVDPEGSDTVNGFVTNTGRFVDRDEAKQLALSSGQINPTKAADAEKKFGAVTGDITNPKTPLESVSFRQAKNFSPDTDESRRKNLVTNYSGQTSEPWWKRQPVGETETGRHASYAGDSENGIVLHSAKQRATVFLSEGQKASAFLKRWNALGTDAKRDNLVESFFNGQYSPAVKKQDWTLKPPGADGFSKAWITPEGVPLQLGGTWHEPGLEANPALVKKFGVKGKDLRVAALQKGFARVNFNPGRGVLTIETTEKSLNNIGPAIVNFVDRNASKIDAISVTTFDPSVKRTIGGGYRQVFEYDDKDKARHIPGLTEEPENEVNLSPQASRPSTLSPNIPNPEVRENAADYMKRAQLPYTPHEGYTPIDEPYSRATADFYQNAIHNPSDPDVQAAYKAFGKETVAQWQHLAEKGMDFEPWTEPGQPYKNSAEMTKDVRDNHHLWYFPTSSGFGTAEAPDHPLLGASGVTRGEQALPLNDIFRAVHDYYGHAKEGYEFGPRGEYNAYQAHKAMYSKLAQGAMGMETHGQNSWVNFGPHMRNAEGTLIGKGEPGYLPITERPYADQKAGVLPPTLQALAPNIDEAAKSVAKITQEKGGATFDVAAGKVIGPTDAFGVSLYPERSKILEPDQVSVSEVKNFILRNADLLANPAHAVGTWLDKSTGKVYLDVTAALKPRSFAMFAGERMNQKAIWDSARSEEIPTQGTGTSVENAPPIQTRAQDLQNEFEEKTALPRNAFNSKYKQQGMLSPDTETPKIFSQAAKVIDEKFSGESMPKAQLAAMLRNPNTGVKAEEMKWSGLDDFLKGSGRVSKKEVQDFLAVNNVKIHEEVLGTSSDVRIPTNDDWSHDSESMDEERDLHSWRFGKYQIDTLANKGEGASNTGEYNLMYETIPSYGADHEIGKYYTLQDAKDAAAEDVENASEGTAAQYDDYRLPGGEKYREVLFIFKPTPKGELSALPVGYKLEQTPAQFSRAGHLWQVANEDGQAMTRGNTKEEALEGALSLLNKDRRKENYRNRFKASHWDAPNVLAHARVDDRVDDAGNPGLFLEEIQSDWHQQGRRQGYAGVNPTPVLDKTSMVPDAPFKTTWHEMVFRRILQKAIEENKNWIGWTTGDQQADRYDLSKRVKKLTVVKKDSGQFEILGVGSNNEGYKLGTFPVEKLPDVVGKDLADRIANQKTPNEVYAGNDLKIGGEGMRGFYDKMLPDYANKFGKKFGAKVGVREIPGLQPAMEIHALPITPQMKESISKSGLPLFSPDTDLQKTTTRDSFGEAAKNYAANPLHKGPVRVIPQLPARKKPLTTGPELQY